MTWNLKLAAFAMAATVGVLPAALSADDSKPITISGCVKQGAADAIMLTGVRMTAGEPPVGIDPDQIFLRLDSTKALKEHVGHEVSVSGMADFTDLDKGTLEASNDGATVTVTLKSERKSVTAVGSAGDPPKTAVGTSGKAEVPTYKMKVQSVSMLAPSCAP